MKNKLSDEQIGSHINKTGVVTIDGDELTVSNFEFDFYEKSEGDLRNLSDSKSCVIADSAGYLALRWAKKRLEDKIKAYEDMFGSKENIGIFKEIGDG